jgi:hypothetical protein
MLYIDKFDFNYYRPVILLKIMIICFVFYLIYSYWLYVGNTYLPDLIINFSLNLLVLRKSTEYSLASESVLKLA